MAADSDSRWDVQFPDPETARPNGLIAYGGDLSPNTLLSAYTQGIFPWYSEAEPILWWAPNPRCILMPQDFAVSKRSLRKIRNSGFAYSFDRNFGAVMHGCAMPRKGDPETWLIPEMQSAYQSLFDLGYAHSVEIWQQGNLVGGVYGVYIGRAFFGESMFRLAPEASRAALVCLIALLRELNVLFLDCQLPTAHMLAMGAFNIPRKLFTKLLAKNALPQQNEASRASFRDYEKLLGPIEGIPAARRSERAPSLR